LLLLLLSALSRRFQLCSGFLLLLLRGHMRRARRVLWVACACSTHRQSRRARDTHTVQEGKFLSVSPALCPQSEIEWHRACARRLGDGVHREPRADNGQAHPARDTMRPLSSVVPHVMTASPSLGRERRAEQSRAER
jgi:hypothetical protein